VAQTIEHLPNKCEALSSKPTAAKQQQPQQKSLFSKVSSLFSIPFIFSPVVMNSGLHACKAGTLLLEPHLQSVLLWLF
jgi:hypothetical protein